MRILLILLIFLCNFALAANQTLNTLSVVFTNYMKESWSLKTYPVGYGCDVVENKGTSPEAISHSSVVITSTCGNYSPVSLKIEYVSGSKVLTVNPTVDIGAKDYFFPNATVTGAHLNLSSDCVRGKNYCTLKVDIVPTQQSTVLTLVGHFDRASAFQYAQQVASNIPPEAFALFDIEANGYPFSYKLAENSTKLIFTFSLAGT